MKKDGLALALLWLVMGAFCYEVLVYGASPFGGDIPFQFYPWKAYVQASLAEGRLPYWNPYTFAGAPFLANMQSAVFYPFDLLLLLFSVDRFFGLSLLFHLGLGGTGAYLLARLCGASPLPALFAGIAYGLNGFVMIHIPAGNHYTYAGAAWIPWIFFVTTGFVRTTKSRLPWALGGSLVACLHFLCGHPQMLFYSLFFSLFLCLGMGVWETKRVAHGSLWLPVIRTGVWGGFLALGIGMAGMQFYPTLEYVFAASRASSISLQAATEFSFAPHRLITLLLPEYYGTRVDVFSVWNHYDSFVYWSCAYAGAITPCLAVALFLSGKKPITAIPLAALAGLALLLAWGRDNPFYTLVYQLPGFGHFRAPAKFLPYFIVPTCVLAALGIEALAAARESKETTRRDPRIWLGMLGAALLFLFTGLGRQLPTFYALLRALPGEDVQRIRMYTTIIGGLLLFTGFVLYRIARKVPRHGGVALAVAMLSLLVVDLFSYGRVYFTTTLKKPEQIRAYAIAPEELAGVRAPLVSKTPERVATLRDIIYPNLFICWRRATIAGYDPLSLQSFNQVIGAMEGWEPGGFHDDIRLTVTDHPVLDLLNVRYILTRRELNQLGLKERAAGTAFRVYERTSGDPQWAMEAVRSVTGEAGWRPAPLLFTAYTPHEIRFTYPVEEETQLRVAEWAYPGWRVTAQVNGALVEVPVEASAEGLRVLTLPAHAREMRMYYDPPVWGWVLAGLSWLGFGLASVVLYLKRTDWIWPILARVLGRDY